MSFSGPGTPASAADAYSAGAVAWAAGPGRIYARLAELLIAASPVPLAGRLLCDVGAGTGVASRAARAAGARVVATDLAHGMLVVQRSDRPPAVVADATSLPFRDHVLGGVVAAYCYNHLDDPTVGLREGRRVTAPGGPVLASAYADDDTHPVKDASEQALREIGWAAPGFHADFKQNASSKLATVPRAEAAARAAGLHAIAVAAMRAPFPELTVAELVEWRLGMAHTAWFVNQLPPGARDALVARTVELLGADVPILVRSVIHIAALA